jgi:hypothetical protein
MKAILFAIGSLAMFGCSHTVQPITPYGYQPEPKGVVQVSSHPDNFDKAGEVVAETSRTVVHAGEHAATSAYQWMTSDETKGRAAHALSTVEDMSKKAYDAAVEEYHKQANK